MKIQIDTHADSPAEMGIAIATLIACGAPPPKVSGPSAEVIFREVPATGDFNAQACRESFDDAFHKVPALLSFDLWQYVWKKALGLEALRPGSESVSASSLAGNLLFRRGDLTGAELTLLVRDLNEEIYKRSKELKGEISPDDDPSAGVEKAALNSDARGELAQFSDESLTQRFSDEVIKPALAPAVAVLDTLDLVAIFNKASADFHRVGGTTEVVTLRVDNQTAEAIKADPAGAAQALAGTVQLDKAGLPWDSRIHAGSKAMVADGTWRQRRGVDPAIVATVEAELRQAMGVPRGEIPAADQFDTHGSPELDADAAKLEAMGGDAGPTLGDVGLLPNASRIPPPPPRKSTAAAPPAAQAADTGEIDTFPRLLKFITEQKLAGHLAQAQVAAALTAIGIEGPLPVLQARPDLIPAMVAKLRAIGGV